MKRIRVHLLALGFIVAVVFLFYLPLWFPAKSVIVTPDFARSDSWHHSFAIKYLLSQALKANTLPLWTPLMGMGFPLLAEGPVGAFYLPNIILFRIFDAPTAYNLSLILALTVGGVGMYLWLTALTSSRIPSLSGALSLVVSGLVVTQATHLVPLQAFLLLPLLSFLTFRLAQKPALPRAAGVSLVLFQQITVGFPQATFISGLFLTGYYLWLIRDLPGKVTRFILFFSALLFGAGAAAIQLLPSVEFMKYITVGGGFSLDTATYFSFPVGHLITFLFPFALGNPKDGSYPPFSIFDGSIFWENTGYIGIMPLLFIPAAFFSKSVRRNSFIFGAALLTAFLLMLGKYSPLYFLYAIWPFTIFRVPSRFIWVFVYCLIVLSTLGASWLWRKYRRSTVIRMILIALMLGNIVHLFTTWSSYHAFGPAATWLTPPKIATLLNQSDRVYTIGSEAMYNSVFLTKGWRDLTPYLFFENNLIPNNTVFWNLSSSQAYSARTLKRHGILMSLLGEEVRYKDGEATASAFGDRLLRAIGISAVVTSGRLTSASYQQAGEVTDAARTISLYRAKDPVYRAYLAVESKTARTVREAVERLKDPGFSVGKTALTETDLPYAIGPEQGSVSIQETSINGAVYLVDNPSQYALLVVAETYYPGWSATVDGAPSRIYPTNMVHRGVLVPKGRHEVRFTYQPESLTVGAVVTIGALTFITLAAVSPLLEWPRGIRQKISVPPAGHQNNPDM